MYNLKQFIHKNNICFECEIETLSPAKAKAKRIKLKAFSLGIMSKFIGDNVNFNLPYWFSLITQKR